MFDQVFEILDECLNNGCLDSRCDWNPHPAEDEDHFPEQFVKHLTEEILKTLDD